MNKLGCLSKANNGSLMVVVAYRNENDIDVRFENGVIVAHQKYNDFVNGNIKCV